ncbi:splicing factor, CC1-like protein [Wilcoxina mikolae CBS 423.85]|nr:splicing factor, CC1-like protein [Wilcoxina mikolae CBS 423.85]
MSSLDVEALLEASESNKPKQQPDRNNSVPSSPRPERNGGGSVKSSSSRRDHDKDRSRDDRGDRHRRRSRSNDRRRRDSYYEDRDDYYDSSSRYRHRSREDRDDDRYYSSRRDRRDRDYYDERDRDDHRDRHERTPRRSRSPRKRGERGGGRPRTRSRSPQLTEDERDRRTVFVQQLAARLRTKELIAFFEKVGPVKEAQIVKDRVSGRSKGVGYVEFKEEASVQKAIQLTGQRLLGIPIIAQLTEAEKNRQARVSATETNTANQVPFHRLYVGNIHFSITEADLTNVFEPFGELEFVQLQKEESGRSRGYGFVQFRDPNNAREALEKMNGFDLAGRPIRVGLGNDKFTPESTAQMLQRFSGYNQGFQGSAFESRSRGTDRVGRADDKATGTGASALDDTDVAGVNFNNYSRDLLMRKLARQDDPAPVERNGGGKDAPRQRVPETVVHTQKPLPVNVPMASRCVVLKNMFDPAEETGEAWIKELEDDVKTECEEKYGHVVHISLDPNSQGEIYIKFDKVSGGEKAIQGLNGRFFGGKRISASPVVDAVYASLFGRASSRA